MPDTSANQPQRPVVLHTTTPRPGDTGILDELRHRDIDPDQPELPFLWDGDDG